MLGGLGSRMEGAPASEIASTSILWLTIQSDRHLYFLDRVPLIFSVAKVNDVGKDEGVLIIKGCLVSSL